MNENKKLLVIGIIFAVVALIVPIVSFSNARKTEKIMNAFTNSFENAEKNLLYIGRDSCSYCQIFTPELNDLNKIYDFGYTYINTDAISQTQLDEIFSKLGIDSAKFGTPYFAVVQDSKIIEEKQGYLPEDELFEFLQKNELIAAEETLPLNYLNFAEYNALLDTNAKEVIVFGQVGCGACEAARPILYEIGREKGVKINYFNVSYLEKEQSEDFGNSLAYLNENEWGTPLMVVVENKKVIASVNGADTKANYIKFLTDNGFIK